MDCETTWRVKDRVEYLVDRTKSGDINVRRSACLCGQRQKRTRTQIVSSLEVATERCTISTSAAVLMLFGSGCIVFWFVSAVCCLGIFASSGF